MSDEVILTIDGQVERPLAADASTTWRICPSRPRCPTSRGSIPQRQGDGVTLEAILERAGVLPDGELSDLARRPRRLPRLGAARSRSAARGSSSIGWATAAWASSTAARSAS